jgi:hypothetical protein
MQILAVNRARLCNQNNSPTKRPCFNPICCRYTGVTRPNAQARCGCHASTGICKYRKEIRSFVIPGLGTSLIYRTLFDSRFRMTVADDECRESRSPRFQRTSRPAANLRSRPFRRSFDTASWWVVGSHTNAHSGNTSTAALLALDSTDFD